jgi:CBS domain-containing protein
MRFENPVSSYMTRRLEVARASATVGEVEHLLREHRISAVPLVDEHGAIVGVVSRSDLLRGGVAFPQHPAFERVTRAPLVCRPDTPLRDAARQMVHHDVHRLFVVDGARPVGVISSLDLTAVVRDARVEGAIEDLMSSPVVTIAAETPIADATEALKRMRVTALVVIDTRTPIGVFSQTEALAAAHAGADTRVEDVMDAAVICLRAETKIFHAASMAARLDVRRVVVSRHSEAVGIVSGLDFARVVAGGPPAAVA